MPADILTAILILQLIAEGIGVAEEIRKIAQRALDGEVVTAEEIAAAREEMKDAVAGWDKAANLSKPELVTSDDDVSEVD